MQKGYRACRVCGKEYEYCRTHRASGVFRWQDVACCPEHGAIYLARVEEARGTAKAVPASEPEVKDIPEAAVEDSVIAEETIAADLPKQEEESGMTTKKRASRKSRSSK